MNELITIEKIGIREALEIAGSPNDPHVHSFEELLVGMEGILEHFIDFRASSLHAPYVSFISKGKVHRVKPAIADGKCSIWVIRFNTEFIPETTFQLYSHYHEHANIGLKNDESFNNMTSLCGIMYEEMQKENPCLPVVRDLLKDKVIGGAVCGNDTAVFGMNGSAD